jgi:hypothetical protein
MHGRNIRDGVVILHEALHQLHTKKIIGVILKLDFLGVSKLMERFTMFRDALLGFFFSCLVDK